MVINQEIKIPKLLSFKKVTDSVTLDMVAYTLVPSGPTTRVIVRQGISESRWRLSVGCVE